MRKQNRCGMCLGVLMVAMIGVCVAVLIIGRHLESCSLDGKGRQVEVEVLSIAENILHGEMIGMFLGSADGHIDNDRIKVGVKFSVGNRVFLEDFELRHSELAYYRGGNKIAIFAYPRAKPRYEISLSLLPNRRHLKNIRFHSYRTMMAMYGD